MLSPADFRDLVSGRRQGLRAGILRSGLRIGEIPYTWAVNARNALYDRGVLQSRRVSASVISVGNLTVGGTGKSPLVEWLARWFCRHDVAVGIVSRGYKSRAGAPNDEALELSRKLPEVPHLQDRNRVAAAQQIIARYGCRVVLLDDAFQHRRIQRDLDLVLLDALEPFGWGHTLPRGTLREPLSGLFRADLVALSRSDAVSDDQRQSIREQVRSLAPKADWVELVHQPIDLVSADGRRQPLDGLAACRVAAFCGIGNPDGFRHTIRRLGCQLAGFRCYPDHHAYPASDLADLDAWIDRLGNIDLVLCTQKDLVKLNCGKFGRRELWAVSIGLDIPCGRELLERRLQSVLEERGEVPRH